MDENSHEGKKTYVCNVCDKTFKNSRNLKNHVTSVHTNKTEISENSYHNGS